MEFRQLQTFIQAAQLQSFSRAAVQLGYSQSAVTVQIRMLEKELGPDGKAGGIDTAGTEIFDAREHDPLRGKPYTPVHA